jgi:hypothetical protein
VFITFTKADNGGVDLDDLDSFFDDIEDDFEPVVEQRRHYDDEEGTPTPEEVVETYIPEEPVPEFESNYEMYMFYARKYMIEISLVGVVLVYILNFFTGKSVNTKIVAMWLTESLPVLKDNFAHLGFGDEPNASLSQVTYDEFEFYATGRDNMGYIFMNLRTKKRQDAITGAIMGLIWPSNDRVVIDIPIETDLPLELIVCKESTIKLQISEMPHLKGLVKQYSPEAFKDTKFGFLAENGEVVDCVFSRKFVNILIKYEKYLEFLHITDQKVYTNNGLVLKCEINMGDHPSEFEHSVKLLEAMIELVDHIVTNVKLPSRVVEKAMKVRGQEQRQKNLEKENEERERIQELKDQELKNKLATMAPAEKKKFLEKLEKTEKKKAMRGKNKVVKF